MTVTQYLDRMKSEKSDAHAQKKNRPDRRENSLSGRLFIAGRSLKKTYGCFAFILRHICKNYAVLRPNFHCDGQFQLVCGIIDAGFSFYRHAKSRKERASTMKLSIWSSYYVDLSPEEMVCEV